MSEKENPIDRVWAWQFLFPLYAFAFILLVYVIVSLFSKHFDMWILISVVVLIVIYYVTTLIKRTRSQFYYIFDTDGLVIKFFGSAESKIPYAMIKTLAISGHYYLFTFSRLYRITLEIGDADQPPPNELYNVLSRPNSNYIMSTNVGFINLVEFPGYMLGGYRIPAIKEENVKAFLNKLPLASKNILPEIEGYFLSDSLTEFINSLKD